MGVSAGEGRELKRTMDAGREWFYETLFWAQSSRRTVNMLLAEVEPLQLVLGAMLAALLLTRAARVLQLLLSGGFKSMITSLLFKLLKNLPGVKTLIKKEQEKAINKIKASIGDKHVMRRSELPKSGLKDGVVDLLEAAHKQDKKWQGKCSGTVYMGGPGFEKHIERVSIAYFMFSHANPLHPDIFPSVTQFEAEVVAMTASLLGAKSSLSGGQVCGNMTSGGTESILMAVKATRDFMRATKNIQEPEMIIAESAHSAYDKAAEYFGVRLRRASVRADYRADVQAIRRLVNKNTIMIVGSAPGFPHGVIDPIQELGALALKKRICLHVDLCLGGFVLPFCRKLGYPVPPFDFEVPGVTSMSVDTHKYGLGPKGNSVVLYRHHQLRQHQFVAVTEWSGGLYISPTSAGSRPGGLIAAAWASLMAMGEDGYLKATGEMMEATKKIAEGIEKIDDLYVLGKPDMTVVAFASRKLDIYKVNDVMSSKGWSLNALQRPASIHICVTLQHVDVVKEFLIDLESATDMVRNAPDGFEDRMAPIYGAAAKMPDRGTIKDFLVAYLDSTC